MEHLGRLADRIAAKLEAAHFMAEGRLLKVVQGGGESLLP